MVSNGLPKAFQKYFSKAFSSIAFGPPTRRGHSRRLRFCQMPAVDCWPKVPQTTFDSTAFGPNVPSSLLAQKHLARLSSQDFRRKSIRPNGPQETFGANVSTRLRPKCIRHDCPQNTFGPKAFRSIVLRRILAELSLEAFARDAFRSNVPGRLSA